MGENPEEFRWEARPVLAWALRVMIVILPVIGGFLAAWGLSTLLPPASSTLGVLGWWAAVLTAAVVGAGVVEVLARRLVPLHSLLSASLLFPGRPPQRWQLAARRASRAQLMDRLETARRDAEDGDVHALTTMLALISLLQAHDPRTRGHAERVRMLADLLTHEMGLPEPDRDRLRWAALLHDIGKLDISYDVLHKDGPLDDGDWTSVRQHPARGLAICAPLLGWLGPHATAIGQHHERFGGGGYPEGLEGEEIGRSARIVSVVDAFEVMTGPRSYKARMSVADARRELSANAGTQFDPAVVRAFLGLSIRRLVAIAGPGAAASAFLLLRPSPAFASSALGAGAVGLATLAGVIPTPGAGQEQVVESPAVMTEASAEDLADAGATPVPDQQQTGSSDADEEDGGSATSDSTAADSTEGETSEGAASDDDPAEDDLRPDDSAPADSTPADLTPADSADGDSSDTNESDDGDAFGSSGTGSSEGDASPAADGGVGTGTGGAASEPLPVSQPVATSDPPPVTPVVSPPSGGGQSPPHGPPSGPPVDPPAGPPAGPQVTQVFIRPADPPATVPTSVSEPFIRPVGPPVSAPAPFVRPAGPPIEPPGPPVDPPGPPVDPPGPPVDPPGPPVEPPGQTFDPPGQSLDPPGSPGDPPGQTFDPPGQTFDPPGQTLDPAGPPVDPGPPQPASPPVAGDAALA